MEERRRNTRPGIGIATACNATVALSRCKLAFAAAALVTGSTEIFVAGLVHQRGLNSKQVGSEGTLPWCKLAIAMQAHNAL